MKSINGFFFSPCLSGEFLEDSNSAEDYEHRHGDVLHSKTHYILIIRLILTHILLAGLVCLGSLHLVYNTSHQVGWHIINGLAGLSSPIFHKDKKTLSRLHFWHLLFISVAYSGIWGNEVQQHHKRS